MPKGDNWRKVTVGSSAQHEESYKRIWCEDCERDIVIHVRDLIETYQIPPQTPFWTLVQRLVCGKCRSKKVGMMLASHEKAGNG
jgi:Zn finger protein HypA/HybF involved in hydrogenase expression